MSSLVPYLSYMKLGQGFNSYTQEVCIERAVLIKPRVEPRPTVSAPIREAFSTGGGPNGSEHEAVPARESLSKVSEVALPSSVPVNAPPPAKNLSQIVTYSSRSVSNMSDIIDALQISASASIKYGTVKGSGSAAFVNENKVSQSDINYIITVKVTNAMTIIPNDMTFLPLDGLDPRDFTEVFGDSFISGFLEGGEFSAIVSIVVNDKSKVAEVKAAAEVDLAIAAVPGMTAGTSSSLDKKKSSVWNDTETTISVNWSGGGEIKDPATKWDLATVVDVASRFPHLVEFSAQRTSAILTKYSSLRSFVLENTKLVAKVGKGRGYMIRDYTLCHLYTNDLFSAFMTYKNLWTNISDMMKHMGRYQELEKTKEVPDPIRLTPRGLNEARLFCRQQMTVITAENARLVTEPELADVDIGGKPRPLPYVYPNELEMRLPVKVTFDLVSEILEPGKDHAILTADEVVTVGTYARRPDLHFNPLSGGPPSSGSTRFRKGKSSPFCTLDTTQDAKTIGDLTKVRFHAHEHHHGEIFADFQQHSKSCQGYLSAIGFSTNKDKNTKPGSDGTHHHAGRPNDNETFWSGLADFSFAMAANVVIEYVHGSEKITSIVLLDARDNEITSWKQYGQAQNYKPEGLSTDKQSPPDARGDWQLAGFWGHSDALVITRIGAIWKRVRIGSMCSV